MKNKNKLHRISRFRYITSQAGQSMIEYTVVVIFGFILLTQGPMSGVVDQVEDAIRNNYSGYSYAMSLPDFPDADNQASYQIMLNNYQLSDDRVAMLADDPQSYHDDIKQYNIPNPPNIKSMINDAINDIKNVNFP